jgi:signal peptidase I
MTNDCSQETGSSARVWIGRLLIAGIAAVSLVLIYQPVKLEGNSMTPLLTNNDVILINRLVYHFEPIQRGDVVVFRYPLDARKSFIRCTPIVCQPQLTLSGVTT